MSTPSAGLPLAGLDPQGNVLISGQGDTGKTWLLHGLAQQIRRERPDEAVEVLRPFPGDPFDRYPIEGVNVRSGTDREEIRRVQDLVKRRALGQERQEQHLWVLWDETDLLRMPVDRTNFISAVTRARAANATVVAVTRNPSMFFRTVSPKARATFTNRVAPRPGEQDRIDLALLFTPHSYNLRPYDLPTDYDTALVAFGEGERPQLVGLSALNIAV